MTRTVTLELPDYRPTEPGRTNATNELYDNLARILTLHDRAYSLGISWRLDFLEGEGNWEVELTSPAQSECLSMRDSPLLEHVLTDAINHCEEIIRKVAEYRAEQERIDAQTVMVATPYEYHVQRNLMAIRVAALNLYPRQLQVEFREWWQKASADYSCLKKVEIPVPFSEPIIEPYDLVERTHKWLDDHGLSAAPN
jgi:hypothetical protein